MSKDDSKKRSKLHCYVFNDANDWGALRQWWAWLDENRGERAKLRRCETPEDVLLQSGFHQLCKKLPKWEESDLIALAAVAGLLSHLAYVPEVSDVDFSRQLGRPKDGGDRAAMSELRFQQLMASEGIDEFYSRLRRAIQLLKRNGNIISIADGVFHWSREQRSIYKPQPSQRFKYAWSKAYFSSIL